MLATFVIGLREGLEAALIVGIIAAFLRKNGKSLASMWIGVVVAVLLSIAVGVTLELVERNLPQAAQEGMETVIGTVAIVFVTGMVMWMSTHARFMKKDLEASARNALGDGTSRALALMAFLAVLKEGFESAVFLLATFQAASNTATAAGGAVLGILVATGLGIGIYRGGVRINLGRFFKVTSVFLVLVAAGLVLTALRTAHEAGWLNAGQQRTVDLHWLAPAGSVRGALFTGVLGIPPDPRIIEILGWLAYLVPMMLILFWPAAHRPGAQTALTVRLSLAATALVAAVLLPLSVPAATFHTPSPAGLVTADGSPHGTAQVHGRTLTLTLPHDTRRVTLSGGTPTHEHGTAATHFSLPAPSETADLPAKLTAQQLVEMNGGRVPVGIDVKQSPGPYAVHWSRSGGLQVWTAHGVLLDARQKDVTVATLSGGGLPTSRTVTVAAGADLPGAATIRGGGWSVETAYPDRVAASIGQIAIDRDERGFWRHSLPIGLLIAAAALIVTAVHRWRGRPRATPPSPTDGASDATTKRSNTSVS